MNHEHQTQPMTARKHTGTIVDSVNGFDVVECTECSFKHILPLPTTEDIDPMYRVNYYTEEKPLYLDHVRADLDWWQVVFAGRFDTFEKELHLDRRRILDVGSGPGFLLEFAKERGWSTLGIEPSARAAQHARGLGLEIVEDFLTPRSARDLGTFDVVHLSEVLEHVPEPGALLEVVHGLLNPGGLIYVETPNDYSPFQHVLRVSQGFAPWWVVPPHHVNYFNFDSLSGLLRRHGFEIILREASFPIDMFLLMGENYVGNDALGRDVHARRKRFDIALAKGGEGNTRRALYQAMASVGIGRDICLFGRKTTAPRGAA